MTKYNADVSKEWGEIGFGSSKRDGYSHKVAYHVDGVRIDRAYYKSMDHARRCKALFELGMWDYGPYGEVRTTSFAQFDVEVFD